MNTILFIQPIICDTFLRKFLNLLFFVAFVDGLFNYSNHSFCCLFPFFCLGIIETCFFIFLSTRQNEPDK